MLSRISKHLKCMRYVDLAILENVVNGVDYLPFGTPLRRNIMREMGEEQIILDHSFDYKSFPLEYLQQIRNLKQKNPLGVFNLRNFHSSSEESPEFQLDSCQVLCSTSLVNTKHAFELFYQLQRQRKIWWMKFVYNPGQIVFANPTRTERSQSISISMKSTEFNMELERIELSSSGDSLKISALQSWFVVDRAVVAFLIDSLAELSTTNDLTMYLHRKLSPYKIGILSEGIVGKQEQEDLMNLQKLMNYELEQSNLDVFHGYDMAKSLKDNLSYSDRIGIPYNLILSQESLGTGLLKLRSRNTTLSDVIHISDIPECINMLINR